MTKGHWFRKLTPSVVAAAGMGWFGWQGWQQAIAPGIPAASRLALLPVLQNATSQQATVLSVIDGDSLQVKLSGQTVTLQLCGIDAPELTQPQGPQARTALQSWIRQSDQQVMVRLLRAQPSKTGTAEIAEVWLAPSSIGPQSKLLSRSRNSPRNQPLNQFLVAAGLAYVYPLFVLQCPHWKPLTLAEAQAKQDARGLWSQPNRLRPWSYRQQRAVQRIARSPHPPKVLRQFPNGYLSDGQQPSTRSTIEIASWYGPVLHGRPTANGERFDQNALTAAHPVLPFNTRIRVTNLLNGRSVIVRINDRHPALHAATLDLAKAAAIQLDAIESGVVPVEVEIVDAGVQR